MRSFGTVVLVAVILSGCSEIVNALLGTASVDIPADSYSVAEGRIWDVPVDISGCNGPPDECVSWNSDNGCVVSFGSGSTATAVHFGTTVVRVSGDSGGSDHATVTVTEQTPMRLDLVGRVFPLDPGATGVLSVKLFDASNHELHRPLTFTTADSTVLVVSGVDPGCGHLWPDGVQIRGVRVGSTFVFARFDNLVDSVSIRVQ